MRTYKLTIAYDGSKYQGWQRQKDKDCTIQGILEKVISDCTGIGINVDGSGRTDAGVHALGQVATVILPGKIDEKGFVRNVNECLPSDIRILKAELKKNGFHARKSAVGKVYEYHVDIAEKQDVFSKNYSYHFPRKLDLDAMNKAAGLLKGTHEFAGFTDKKDEKSTKRTIYDIIISGYDSKIMIQYDGNGFLYHMVRILTGTLLEIGIHDRKINSIPEILMIKDRSKAGFLAPARGLFLKQVYYDE